MSSIRFMNASACRSQHNSDLRCNHQAAYLIIFLPTRANDSEVDAELGTEYGRVRETACAAGPNNVLEVGLNKIGALAQVEAIGQFHHPFVILRPTFRRKQQSISLCALQLITEISVRDSKRNGISRARIEEPAR